MADSICTRWRAASLAALLTLALGAFVSTVAATEPPFRIYYRGQETLVRERLKLDPSTEVVSDPGEAQAAVIQDSLPPIGSDLDARRTRIEAGAGLVLILGEHTDPAALEQLTSGAVRQIGTVTVPLGSNRGLESERIAASIEYTGPPDDALAHALSWRSAGRIHERALLKLSGEVQVLVATTARDQSGPRAPILFRLKLGKGTVYVLNVWLRQGDQRERVASYLKTLQGIEGAENYDFQRWAYFNWLLYYLSHSSAGMAAASYGDWVGSPVPDSHDAGILAALFLAMFAVFLSCYLVTRRYSLRHPEKLAHFYLGASVRNVPTSLGAAAAVKRPVGGAQVADRGDPRWEIIGFHRPLSGFFYNYLLALFVMIPFNFATTFYIERNFVNPFVEARGAWAAVTQFMLFFFTLLDLGTSQAMVKYFAEYRLKQPERSITYAQFFIWFHALAGIFQITALGLVAAIWMPHTVVAFLTWFVILHTLIQFPGFIPIFFNLFRALQRFDYAQLLIVLQYVLNPFVQMICGIYMRRWGLMHPVFGEGMGVVFGFAIGGVIANLLMGLFCAIFYRQVGFKLTTIFLAHFDRDTVRRSLIYGIKLTGGQALGALSWGTLPVIMAILLPDFLELNEIWIVTFLLTFAYLETGAYIFTTLMPSISEAYAHQMHELTRRYLDQGLRWGIMITAMLGGAFVAFSEVFVKGLLPPQFVRAAGVMAVMHLWRAFDFTTRLPDQVFQGVGRTGLYTWTAVIEHIGRIILSYILIKRFGFEGIFYAFIVSSALKALMAWPLMMWLVVAPAISVWQTIVNPILAGAANYAVLRAFALTVWQGRGHTLTSWIVVLVALFGSLPVYMFFTGLLGWDRSALADFKDAAELVPAPFGALARVAYRIVEVGGHLSPLHDRFPAVLIEAASAEARELTAAKAELH